MKIAIYAILLATMIAAPPCIAAGSDVGLAELKSADAIYAEEDRTLFDKEIPGEAIDAAKALAFIYGSVDPATNEAHWRLSDRVLRRSLRFVDCIERNNCGSREATIRVIADRHVTGRGPERYLMITEATADITDGFYGRPIIGGAIFEKTTSGWRIKSEAKMLDSMETISVAPPKFLQLGPQSIGVMLSDYYEHNGVYQISSVLIAELGDRLVPVLALGGTEVSNSNFMENDRPNRESFHYVSRFTTRPGSNPEFFDLVRTTSGTNSMLKPRKTRHPSDDKFTTVVYRFKEVVTYRFRDGRYQ